MFRYFILMVFALISIDPLSAMHSGEKRKADNAQHSAKKHEGEPQGIKITYYNVGQGNCVLMENIDLKQAILVDCGSTE